MPEPLRGLLLTLGHLELAGSEHVRPYVRVDVIEKVFRCQRIMKFQDNWKRHNGFATRDQWIWPCPCGSGDWGAVCPSGGIKLPMRVTGRVGNPLFKRDADKSTRSDRTSGTLWGRAHLGFSYWWRGCIRDRNRATKLLRDIPDELKDYDPLPWQWPSSPSRPTPPLQCILWLPPAGLPSRNVLVADLLQCSPMRQPRNCPPAGLDLNGLVTP